MSEKFEQLIEQLKDTLMFGDQFTQSIHDFKLEKTENPTCPYIGQYCFVVSELTLNSNDTETGLSKFTDIVQELVPLIEDKVRSIPELKEYKIHMSSASKNFDIFDKAREVVDGLRTDPRYLQYFEKHPPVFIEKFRYYPNILLSLQAQVVVIRNYNDTGISTDYLLVFSICSSVVMASSAEDAVNRPSEEITHIRDTLRESMRAAEERQNKDED
jgi:hypothetical protein